MKTDMFLEYKHKYADTCISRQKYINAIRRLPSFTDGGAGRPNDLVGLVLRALHEGRAQPRSSKLEGARRRSWIQICLS